MSRTIVETRVVSCDAKVIGSLVGGCRVRILRRRDNRLLAEGLQLGGSGDTESIMKRDHPRYGLVYGAGDAASCRLELDLEEPTDVLIEAEGPLAFPQALQRASVSTVLVPGVAIEGEGLVLKLLGLIVELIQPHGAETLYGRQAFRLEASVRYL